MINNKFSKSFISILILVSALVANIKNIAAGECRDAIAGLHRFDRTIGAAFDQIAQDQNQDNILYSSFNIEDAFKLLLLASSGATEAELKEFLGHKSEIAKVELLKALTIINQMISESGVSVPEKDQTVLSYAASLWANSSSGHKFAEDFVSRVKNLFPNLTAREIPFKEAEASAKQMNDWASDVTNKLITQVITADDISSDMSAFLATALYIKGKFGTGFEEWTDEHASFTQADGTLLKDIPLMNSEARRPYQETELYQAVQLETKDGLVSLEIILPKNSSAEALKDFRGKYFKGEITIDQEKYENHYLGLQLPRFEIKTKVRFDSVLKDKLLPITTSSKAELPGLGLPFQLDSATHDAALKVFETGFEAAAVTMLGGLECAHMPPNTLMIANRTFAVRIVSKGGIVLFNGWVNKPTALAGQNEERADDGFVNDVLRE